MSRVEYSQVHVDISSPLWRPEHSQNIFLKLLHLISAWRSLLRSRCSHATSVSTCWWELDCRTAGCWCWDPPGPGCSPGPERTVAPESPALTAGFSASQEVEAASTLVWQWSGLTKCSLLSPKKSFTGWYTLQDLLCLTWGNSQRSDSWSWPELPRDIFFLQIFY